MRIGLLVNVMPNEISGQTTYRIAAECAGREHEVWLLSTGSFSYEPDNRISAKARPVPLRRYRSPQQLTEAIRTVREESWIIVDDLDVLLLRSEPSVQRAWARGAGMYFGRIAARRGVIVLNHPNGLAKAMNKLYLQTFPEEIRPRTLITRDLGRIEQFARELGTVILKPLQGSKGKNVFLIQPGMSGNLEQMVTAVSRDGYVIAQEYLPQAAEGDTRLFMMNGSPLRYQGRYAAFRRIRTSDDIRSNVHVGGRLRRADVSEAMLRLAEIIRPRLVEDGMFLVGLDIVGDKLIEINVFSPGGLGSARKFEKVRFECAVVDALERKVQYMERYQRRLSSVEIATL
jgi:glutathione synthase